MDTVETVISILREIPIQTNSRLIPSTAFSELFDTDDEMLMEFLLAIDEKYDLEFKDVVTEDGRSLEFPLTSLRNWTIEKFADYIDTHGEPR